MLFRAIQEAPTSRLSPSLLHDIGCGSSSTCSRALGGVGYLCVMGLAALVAGAFADKVGHRPRALAVSLAVCAVFTGIGSGCSSFGALVVPRFVSALANAAALPLLLPLLVERSKRAGNLQCGALLGIFCCAFPLADGLLAFLDWVGSWRTAFAALSVTALLVALPLFAINDRQPPGAAEGNGGKGEGKEPGAVARAGGRWLCGAPRLDDVLRETLELPALLRHSSSLGLLLASQVTFGYTWPLHRLQSLGLLLASRAAPRAAPRRAFPRDVPCPQPALAIGARAR